jgi:hypothetical protein
LKHVEPPGYSTSLKTDVLFLPLKSNKEITLEDNVCIKAHEECKEHLGWK